MTNYDLSHLTQTDDQWVIGPIQDDEALFLYSIIRGKRIKTIFEIGGLEGYSAKNFLAAVGPTGKVYTVDRNTVIAQAANHSCIQKDALMITAEDLDNTIMEIVYFDCHDYDVQMAVYHNLVKFGLINSETILALHDTNLHYTNKEYKYCRGPTKEYNLSVEYNNEIIAYIHQPVERQMVNTFVDMGYHAFSLHTTPDKHDETFPNRHGVTILSSFQKLIIA